MDKVNHFAAYVKPDRPNSQQTYQSFRDLKSTIYLKCGNLGHWANTCTSNSNRLDYPRIIAWKNNQHVNKAGMPTCLTFNDKGSCTDSSSDHSIHSCTLCGNSSHGASACPQN